MTTTRTRGRRAALLTVGVLAVGTATGCQIARGGAEVVDTATVLSGFAEWLSDGPASAHTATYRVSGGGQVTVVRRPSEAAFLTGRGRLIVTADHLIRCVADTCHRVPNRDVPIADAVAVIAGPGFVTAEDALAAVATAALAPGARAKPSHQTIAGLDTDCVEVTGPEATDRPALGTAPGPAPVVTGDGFTVCVTGAGVLAAVHGTLTDGRQVAVQLTRLDRGADPAALTPPPGASVTDVPALPAG